MGYNFDVLGGFMKKEEFFKKFWFVIVIAVLAVGFVGYYAIYSAKNAPVTVETKQKDGKYLIYSLNDDAYTADELYDELYSQLGESAAITSYERMVVDKAIETTSEMKETAANSAAYLLQNYKSAELDSELKKMGFGGIDGLNDYYIYLQKSSRFAKDYFTNRLDELVIPYVEKNNSKIISHILIKVANVEKVTNDDKTTTLIPHPTDEEQAKLDAVLKALEDKDFAEVAKEYSEDGSASSGGSLGYFDKSSSEKYVAEFYNGAVNLKEGQVSEPVVSQYGYHIIRCDASEPKSLLDNDSFIANLTNAYSARYTVALYEKGEELGITIEDEKLKTAINNVLESARNEITKENEEEAK